MLGYDVAHSVHTSDGDSTVDKLPFALPEVVLVRKSYPESVKTRRRHKVRIVCVCMFVWCGVVCDVVVCDVIGSAMKLDENWRQLKTADYTNRLLLIVSFFPESLIACFRGPFTVFFVSSVKNKPSWIKNKESTDSTSSAPNTTTAATADNDNTNDNELEGLTEVTDGVAAVNVTSNTNSNTATGGASGGGVVGGSKNTRKQKKAAAASRYVLCDFAFCCTFSMSGCCHDNMTVVILPDCAIDFVILM